MQPAIAARKAEVAALCRRLHARRLDVFGSSTGPAFDPARSDVDLLVEFESDAPGRAFDAYFDLKDGLEALFGRSVDLIVAGAVENPYLLASIERSREVLYAAARIGPGDSCGAALYAGSCASPQRWPSAFAQSRTVGVRRSLARRGLGRTGRSRPF